MMILKLLLPAIMFPMLMKNLLEEILNVKFAQKRCPLEEQRSPWSPHRKSERNIGLLICHIARGVPSVLKLVAEKTHIEIVPKEDRKSQWIQ